MNELHEIIPGAMRRGRGPAKRPKIEFRVTQELFDAWTAAATQDNVPLEAWIVNKLCSTEPVRPYSIIPPTADVPPAVIEPSEPSPEQIQATLTVVRPVKPIPPPSSGGYYP